MSCGMVESRNCEVTKTEMIVAQEMIRSHRRAKAIDLAPVVHRFQAAIDGIVQAELRRFQSRLQTLTPDQHQALLLCLRGIAARILDPVIRSLKRAAYNGDSEKVARICALFNLAPLLLKQGQEDESISSALDQLDLLVA
jgi:glutamyl-tRNA reductase